MKPKQKKKQTSRNGSKKEKQKCSESDTTRANKQIEMLQQVIRLLENEAASKEYLCKVYALIR